MASTEESNGGGSNRDNGSGFVAGEVWRRPRVDVKCHRQAGDLFVWDGWNNGKSESVFVRPAEYATQYPNRVARNGEVAL